MRKKPVFITASATVLTCLFIYVMYGTGDSDSDYISEYLNTLTHNHPTYITATRSTTKVTLPSDDVEDSSQTNKPTLPGLASRPTITTGEWAVALEARKCAYYDINTMYWDIVEVCGTQYLCERQTGAAYDSVPKASNSIRKRGCLMYALQTIVTSLSGKLYSVEDQIIAGGGIPVWNGAKWQCTSYPYNGTVGTSSGGELSVRVNALNNAYSLRIQASSDLFSLISPEEITTKLSSGSMFLLHVSNDTRHMYSSSGEHWFVLCAYDANSTWYTLQCPKSTIDVADRAYLMSVCNHIYEFTN